MKYFLSIFLFFTTAIAYCQDQRCSSQQVVIAAGNSTQRIITLKQTDTMFQTLLPDIIIRNHKGEIKRTLTGLKGVSVKNILQQLKINDNPKLLSEYYFVFTACDGYRVVYSWNEIFNTASGDNTYFVTEKNGTTISSVTITDVQTGRRYVQGLSAITLNHIHSL